MAGFSVSVFYVVFRQCTEIAVVVAILYSCTSQVFRHDDHLKRALAKSLWLGTGTGFAIAAAIAAMFLIAFYKLASDLWDSADLLWEACFSLLSSILLVIAVGAFLEADKLTAKWERRLQLNMVENFTIDAARYHAGNSDEFDDEIVPLSAHIQPYSAYSFENVSRSDSKYVLEEVGREKAELLNRASTFIYWVPFVTILREGTEGIVFLGGIGNNEPAKNAVLPAIVGILCGILLGWIIYKASNSLKLRPFFISASITFMYISAGLMATAITKFETNSWNKNIIASERNIKIPFSVQETVWNLNCCNPEDQTKGGWQLFQAFFGWNNRASIGSIIGYVIFWLAFSGLLVVIKLLERRRRKSENDRISFKLILQKLFRSRS